MLQIKKTFPYPLEYGTKEISGERERGIFLHCSIFKGPFASPTCTLQGSSYAPSATITQSIQLTEILTSEGHVFDQELAFRLLEVPFTIFQPQ